MSPEQAAGHRVDFRSDQFAFGLVLYEMVTGRVAFARPTAVQTMSAIIAEEPRRIADLNPRVPERLQEIIRRCLAKAPADRYASTLDLARDVRAIAKYESHMRGLSDLESDSWSRPKRTAARCRSGGCDCGCDVRHGSFISAGVDSLGARADRGTDPCEEERRGASVQCPGWF